MSRLKLSDQAAQDIEDIWNYIAQENPQAADNILDKLRERFFLLTKFPELGRVRPDLAPSVRGFPVGNYIIFYRSLEQGIEIVRVLRGSRDLRRIFQVAEDTETEEEDI
ncbi:type II toxin-antitoxin system RelE/ParE family toxin [Coleofasciculus sp. E1-EBD-02]|uniref:type II toxin-antitoxin system RelE/ParE family toxin n=1 Tax=Coleofasciculus sp. E1-EBD-02 TaxID=3068481 RepID=UPI0032F222F1